MDGEAIYSALLSNAQLSSPFSSFPTRTLQHLPSSPTIAPLTNLASNDDKGERIYQALLAAAAQSSSFSLDNLVNSTSPTSVSLLPSSLSALAATSSNATITPLYPGFLTSRLTSLPTTLTILLGVYLIILSLLSLTVGARSVFVGRDLGRTYGSQERKGWLRGGVGGIFFGSTAFGLLVTLLTLLIVSRQEEAKLGGWATVSIIVLCSIPGGIAGGRWSWASRTSVAIVGSTTLALLLTVSFHIMSTLPRLIITLAFLALSALSVNLRYTERFSLPILSALSGSFLLILGIDLFIHLGFIDALGLLVKRNGVGSLGGEAERVVVEWDKSGGKGIVAAWWLLTVASASWQVWWGLGIQGQELWNDYLARYLPTLDPLGTHSPPQTILDRIKGMFSKRRRQSSKNRHEVFTKFSNRQRTRTTPWDEIEDDDEADEDEFGYEKGFEEEEKSMRKGSRRDGPGRGEASDTWDSEVETLASRGRYRPDRPAMSRGGSSKPAQYGAVSSSDEEEEDERGIWSAGRAMDSKSTRSFGASSGSTAISKRRGQGDEVGEVDEQVEKAKRGKEGIVSHHPDEEEDYRSSRPHLPDEYSSRRTTRQVDDNVEFEDREKRLGEDPPQKINGDADPTSSRGTLLFDRVFLRAKDDDRTSPPSTRNLPPARRASMSATPGDPKLPQSSVPATPSLLGALRRVREAQRQARHAPAKNELEAEEAVNDAGEQLAESSSPRPAREALDVERRSSRRASMDEFWKTVVDRSSS